MDFKGLRLSQLVHLARGGDPEAKREVSRRQRDGEPSAALADMTFAQLRALVTAWRSGETEEERADAFNLAARAQDELAARWRVRSRIKWRADMVAMFGPEGLDALTPAPWTAPRPPRCVSWRRPTGSTHYASPESLQREALNRAALELYSTAVGVPHK